MEGSTRRVRTLAGALALALLAAATLQAQFEPELQYQSRGDRWEGLQPGPVGGYDVELISALVDGREETREWPEELRLRFYLHDEDDAHVTVRELEYQEYYWLDKVEPAEPWRKNAFNEFAWPTRTVLQRSGLGLDDLGAVVRLRQELPGKEEWVAPALFYHSRVPAAALGYRFTLKTNGTAYVTCQIYHGATRIYVRQQNRQIADQTFTVHLRSGHLESAGQGWYRLELAGYFEADNSKLSKVVHFYHPPRPGSGRR